MMGDLATLGRVSEIFDANFREGKELGASVSIWWRGQEMWTHGEGWADRGKTRRWTEGTLAPVYSATKGPAAAALLLALRRHGLDQNTPVSEVWRGFSLVGATFAEMMSHQCGLAALDQKASVWNHQEVVESLENQRPAWTPGEGHGYHPRTLGFMYDECVRRLTGISLGSWWWREIAGPAGWEFWIGLPEKEFSRVAELLPGRAEKGAAEQGFYKEFMSDGTMTRRAFLSPVGLHAVQEMNDPRAWSAGFPAMGGVGTARALAQFYQACLGYGNHPFDDEIIAALSSMQVQGDDRVLLQKTAFSCGCQLDPLDADGVKTRMLYGPSLSAFGHPGAGGSHAFGDPENGWSFSYVMNQMTLSVMPGQRSTMMVDALYDISFE